MIKETETEETIGFFVTFLSLVAFQFRRSMTQGARANDCGNKTIKAVTRELEMRITNNKKFLP